MGPLHESVYKVAPAFFSSQVDLFGPFDSFSNLNKRKSTKIWFVITCCTTTSAIDLRVMEDYSTEAFLMAFVRFACRAGYPKYLLPDEGSQLVTGCKSMIICFTDLKQKLHTEYGVHFETCPVGAHYMHGKVERKIQQVANGVNNLPLGLGMGLGNKVECLENLDILTPNRLLLGRNNDRCPSGPLKTVENIKFLLKTNENIYATWFKSWLISYVPTLLNRPKWFKSDENIKVGDVVLFLKSEKEFSKQYQYGIIHSTNVGRDGCIRRVEVQYQNNNEKVKRYTTRV